MKGSCCWLLIIDCGLSLRLIFFTIWVDPVGPPSSGVKELFITAKPVVASSQIQSPGLDSFSPLHFVSSVLLLKGQGYHFTLPPVPSSGCCWRSKAFLSYLRGFLPPSRTLGKLSLPESHAGWHKEALIRSLFTNGNFKKLLYKVSN